MRKFKKGDEVLIMEKPEFGWDNRNVFHLKYPVKGQIKRIVCTRVTTFENQSIPPMALIKIGIKYYKFSFNRFFNKDGVGQIMFHDNTEPNE